MNKPNNQQWLGLSQNQTRKLWVNGSIVWFKGLAFTFWGDRGWESFGFKSYWHMSVTVYQAGNSGFNELVIYEIFLYHGIIHKL